MTRELATVEQALDIKQAERLVDIPPAQWHGRCYEIACALSACLPNSAPVYGHWLGPVDAEGWWGTAVARPFVQHGWILFKDRPEIMDPTRFSFENAKPYIYLGPPDHYDEGGNIWRDQAARPCPRFDHTLKIIRFEEATPNSALSRHLNCLVPSIRMEKCLMIDVKQAFWLANAHYGRLEPFAKEIYLGLEAADLMAYVPHDNWERAFRKW
ncbi:MAG: hypothetical protein DRQ64_00215 [Gammaproteobacteria bacterium]|nr:MAG: hypothetical protein DRQ64_00215 [Gammaproteobacteria bacterium]